MMDTEETKYSADRINFIRQPKYAWRCWLTYNMYWSLENGKQPNWFHRKMQELCFGIKWEKIDG